MPMNCAAVGCSNDGKLSFPRDKKILRLWREAINRQGKHRGSLWAPSPFSKLCHKHFKDDDYRQCETSVVGFERKHLKLNAVPSLNLGTRKTIPAEQGTPRSKRKIKWEKNESLGNHDVATLDPVEVEISRDESMEDVEIEPDIYDIGREEECETTATEATTSKTVTSEMLISELASAKSTSSKITSCEELSPVMLTSETSTSKTSTSKMSTSKMSTSEASTSKMMTTNTADIEGEEEEKLKELDDNVVQVEDELEANAKTTQTHLSTVSVGTDTRSDMPRSYFSIEMFENDSEALLHYTGFKDFEHFCFVFSCLEPAVYRLDYKSAKLSRKNEFLLTMMKLRCAKSDVELAFLFGIGKKSVGLIWNTMIRFLYYHLRDMTPWLPQDIVDMYMPLDFKAKYPGTRVILDGTEFFVQKPSDVHDQSATWSSYKNPSTLKSMIGISPRGVVTHVSPTYGGCTSDRQIIERSELIKKGMFSKGDSIMADRGIMVQDIFAYMDVKVNTPTMLRGRSQLSSEEVIKDRRIAAKRIHVERVIGLAKTYKILASEMHHSQRPLSDKIVFVCFALCNFKPSIIGKYA